ncbi:hypothetical protein TNCV_2282081 [Trichonephila clavipes]|nr:hypothetical protein TNCV_2282081 [Trichonephila clavipes]
MVDQFQDVGHMPQLDPESAAKSSACSVACQTGGRVARCLDKMSTARKERKLTGTEYLDIIDSKIMHSYIKKLDF